MMDEDEDDEGMTIATGTEKGPAVERVSGEEKPPSPSESAAAAIIRLRRLCILAHTHIYDMAWFGLFISPPYPLPPSPCAVDSAPRLFVIK